MFSCLVPAKISTRIISHVLGWDNSELKKRAAAVEKDKNAPSKDQLEVLRHHCEKSSDEHEQYRIESGMPPFIFARQRNLETA